MTLSYNQVVDDKRKVIEKLYNKEIMGEEKYNKVLNYFKIISIPDRIVQFKVVWEDDNNKMQVNKGYRVQHNNALGPYKGGIRFNKDVDLDTLQSLAFEQTFKNAITGLPMGGAKGGADFNPIGKSENEIRKFCRAYTDHLYKYVGSDVDVPAGDLGVGMKEIGYIYGRYKQLTDKHDGAFTGKNVYGSLLREEATGYGLIYFVLNNLKYLEKKEIKDLHKQRILVSGSGCVAIHAVKKILQLGGHCLTTSDITGVIYCKDGITWELFDVLYDLYKNRKLLNSVKPEEYEKYGAIFIPTDVLGKGENLWNQLDKVLDYDQNKKIDIALTCATQHEIDEDSAKNLVSKGVFMVAEGSNFGLKEDAIHVMKENKISYMPGKLSNSGGVMCSQFEMQQNATKSSWTSDDVDKKLQKYVENAYNDCRNTADELEVDLDDGVFAHGLNKIIDTMEKSGYVW